MGIHLDDRDEAAIGLASAKLLAEERAHAETLSIPRRRTWIGGRVALRYALARAGLTAPAILSDPRGAPIVPDGIAASVSHKEHIAIALVARDQARIGVDVERDAAPRRDIASHVLTAQEAIELSTLDEASRAREVLLRFSAKEAIYKALDPFVRRYVAFGEVAVTPRGDGSADVRLSLQKKEGPFVVEARWLRRDGLLLTTARVSREP